MTRSHLSISKEPSQCSPFEPKACNLIGKTDKWDSFPTLKVSLAYHPVPVNANAPLKMNKIRYLMAFNLPPYRSVPKQTGIFLPLPVSFYVLYLYCTLIGQTLQTVLLPITLVRDDRKPAINLKSYSRIWIGIPILHCRSAACNVCPVVFKRKYG